MRKNIKRSNLIYPMPVFIVAAYDENGIPNAMNAAWGGFSSDDEIIICEGSDHKTLNNILKKKAFTVSCGTKDQVVACDYVGCVSGNQVKDKLKNCGWHTTPSKKVNAPIIKELPFTLECELIKYNKITCHMIGKIVGVSVDTKIMNGKKIDIEKLNPIVFNGEDNTYHLIGKKVGDAFKDYKKIK